MKIFTPTKFRRGVDYILLDKYDRLASAVGGGEINWRAVGQQES